MKRPAILLLGLACLIACSDKAPPVETSLDRPATPRTTFVQLFEWKWPDIAQECESLSWARGLRRRAGIPAK